MAEYNKLFHAGDNFKNQLKPKNISYAPQATISIFKKNYLLLFQKTPIPIFMNQENQQTETIKIAFADDHSAVRQTIVAFLHEIDQLQIEVIIQATDGRELIEKIGASSVKPDIIIMDISMPGMNGFEATPIIKKKWPDMKILVLSIHEDEIYTIKMMRLGVNGFLSKGCNPEEIGTALEAIYHQGYYYSEHFQAKAFLAAQSDKYKLPELSAKELMFIKLCCSEYNYCQIAELMHLTQKGVEGCRDVVFKKLNLHSRAGLVLFGVNGQKWV